jgi:hypothetical protein
MNRAYEKLKAFWSERNIKSRKDICFNLKKDLKIKNFAGLPNGLKTWTTRADRSYVLDETANASQTVSRSFRRDSWPGRVSGYNFGRKKISIKKQGRGSATSPVDHMRPDAAGAGVRIFNRLFTWRQCLVRQSIRPKGLDKGKRGGHSPPDMRILASPDLAFPDAGPADLGAGALDIICSPILL